MATEVLQNEKISGGGKNGERKGVGSAVCRRRANRDSVHIKKREQRGVVKRDVYFYLIRVRIKRRKRGGRKFRERLAMHDENDDAVSSVRGITRENARPGVGAIRTQSRASRNP